MMMQEKFTTIDEEDVEDKSAIFYVYERDARLLLRALECLGRTRVDQHTHRHVELLKRQLRGGLRQP